MHNYRSIGKSDILSKSLTYIWYEDISQSLDRTQKCCQTVAKKQCCQRFSGKGEPNELSQRSMSYKEGCARGVTHDMALDMAVGGKRIHVGDPN